MPPPPSKRRSSSRLGNTDASSDVGSEASTASASSSRSKRKLPLNDEQQRPPRPPFSRDVSVASWAAVAGSSSALSLCTPVNPASPYDAPLPRCIWCFHLLASHAEQSDGPTEDKCLRRLFPAKSRWEAVVARTPWLATARATRAAAEQQQQAGPRPRGHQQTGRSKALQAAYCAEYKRWWSQEGYALQTAARLALASFNTALLLPLAASAASGEFSDYEMLKLEFVSRLRHHVKPALFAPGGNWGSLNSSANQVFSGRLRAVEPFSAGVASARMPGERCANDFAMLSERYEHVASYRTAVDAKLVHWRTQLQQRHRALARVKQLPADSDSPLLDTFAAITASRGRPLDGDGTLVSKAPAHPKKVNYVGGAFTGGCMVEGADGESSSISTSFKDQRAADLRGAGRLFANVPTEQQMAGRKQKVKDFKLPAASTARGHRRDMARWRIEKAAEALGPVREQIFLDEATRPEGTAVLVMGSRSLLPDGSVNMRLCGATIPLENKMGVTVAAAVLDICRRNKIEICYTPLADSVSSTVGHKTGAVAYLRQEWKTPLIFVIKCVAHKISRGWQRALQQAGGGVATRPPVKRQQIRKVRLNRTVLLLEDHMYLIKSCPPVREEVQEQQR